MWWALLDLGKNRVGREAELLEVVFYPFCSAVKFIRWKILADVTPERGWVGCLVFLLHLVPMWER